MNNRSKKTNYHINKVCIKKVQKKLRWGVDSVKAQKIACNNKKFAEKKGYWDTLPKFKKTIEIAKKTGNPIKFYDSVTSILLFVAPKRRTMNDFLTETKKHGWPSFREFEIVKKNLIELNNGRIISKDGTHLGHNIPDGNNRYCIDLVSISGKKGKKLFNKKSKKIKINKKN